jgi:streptogramin lyase
MTTSGTVTEFATGLSPDDIPAGFTRAADGSMWFVSNGTGPYVGRVDTSGKIMEVAHLRTTLMSADPSIAQDSSGNFWFTQSDHLSHEFAIEVTAGGKTSRHLLPQAFSLNPCCVTHSAQAFATAADGSVWFANLTYAHQRNGIHLLGHVVNGKVQMVHNRVQYLTSFVVGPGSLLWYAAQDPFFFAPGIGYLTGADGGFHTFQMPRATNPISIAYGADGNLYMSAYNGDTGLLIKATP